MAAPEVNSADLVRYRSSSFQVGEHPSGDVFTASPVRANGNLGRDLPSALTAQFAEHMTATEDRRLTRSATAPNALVMGPPGDRNLCTPSSRHNVDGGDAQRVYPPSACVFVAK